MERGTSPVVGVAVLIGLTVVLAAAVGTAAFALDAPTATPTPAFSMTADGATGTITVTHRGGPPVSIERLGVVIRLDGQRLAHQPPVPFCAAEGFRSGPTGPFNSADEPTWTAGQRASLRLASTNAPSLDSGDTVTLHLYRDGRPAATLRTTAASVGPTRGPARWS